MKKSTSSGAYVSSQSRGGLIVGLNFFVLCIWHQYTESKGIFNAHKESAWLKCLLHDDTHAWYSPSGFPDLMYINNTDDFTDLIFHFKFPQAAKESQTLQRKLRTLETQ